jgi:predicted AAA+ superfamily ATPase
MKVLREKMGDLVHSFGDLAEHLVAPGIAKKFNALGFHFDSVTPGGKELLDDQGRGLAEIDLLLENGEYSVAVEVKSKPKVEDIKEHVNRLKVLRHYMDKHHDSRVIRGAIAGAIFHEGVKRAAIKAGLYVIVQTGDTMQIEVPEKFTPREW